MATPFVFTLPPGGSDAVAAGEGLAALVPDTNGTADCRAKDVIDYFNRTFAKPFRWTYTGRPVTAETTKRPTTWKESWVSRHENGATLALVG